MLILEETKVFLFLFYILRMIHYSVFYEQF